MQINRTEQRIKILETLYQASLYDRNKIKYDINNLINENLEIDNEFVRTTVIGIIENDKNIVEIANKYLKNWTISRFPIPCSIILKLGIYELLYTNTPDIVCINEAVELSKQYSDIKVTNMINAVLDEVYNHKDELIGK